MISAYEHGRNAAKHAKHIQACPFDTGTPEWREWRAGFCALSQISPNSFYRRKGVPGLHGALAAANLYHCRYRYGCVMRPHFVVLYVVTGSFTAALACLTHPTGRSSFPASFIFVTICLLWPLFLWPALSALSEATRRGPSASRALATHRPATRALEENPDRTYKDLAPWKYAELPKALGCADWFTARVSTLGGLDEAMKSARANKTGAYIEIVADKIDTPPALAYAHGRLKAMYGERP
jgi:hypothetical protein